MMKHNQRLETGFLLFVVLMTGFLILIGCGGGGDSDSDDDANTNESYSSDVPVITLAEAERQYRDIIRSRSGNTEEFAPQEGLTAYGIGAFLKNGAFEYQSSAEMTTSAFNFTEHTYNFRTDFSQSMSTSSPSMTSLPAIMLVHNMSSDLTQAKTIEYKISFADVALERMSDPYNLISSEGGRAPNANQLVYGVYTAKIKISFYLLNESGTAYERDASFIDRMVMAEDNVKESTRTSTKFEYALESIEPVQIGFLIKNYSAI